MQSIRTPTDKNLNTRDNALLTHTPPSAYKNTRSKFFKSFSGSKVSRDEQSVGLLTNTDDDSFTAKKTALRISTDDFQNVNSNRKNIALKIGKTPTSAYFPDHIQANTHALDIYSRKDITRNINKNSPNKKAVVPAPLNLELLSPPPSNRKPESKNDSDIKHAKDKDTKFFTRPTKHVVSYLNSPIDVLYRDSIKKDSSPRTPNIPFRNPKRNLFSSITSKASTEFDGFDEPIPDYKQNVHNNILSENSKFPFNLPKRNSNRNNKKNYSMNKCFICEEPLNSLLAGEKVIEMSCQHQCHYDCLLASLHGVTNIDELESNYPMCNVCQKTSKPLDHNFSDEIAKSLLISNQKPDILEGLNNFHVSTTSSKIHSKPKRLPITPTNQMINSPDILQHGFMKTPIKTHNQFAKQHSRIQNAFIHDKSFIKPVLYLNPQTSNMTVSINTKEPLVISHVLSVHLPETLKSTTNKTDNEAQQVSDENDFKSKTKLSMLIIKEFLASDFHLLKNKMLQMFDILNVSFDDSNYSEWLVFLFENTVVLKPLKKQQGGSMFSTKIIELSELHSVIRLPETVLVSFKSSFVPELYFQNHGDSIVLEKWTKVLDRCVERKNVLNEEENLKGSMVQNLELLHFTSNTFPLLQDNGLIFNFPASLYSKIVSYYNDPILCHELIPKFNLQSDLLESDNSDNENNDNGVNKITSEISEAIKKPMTLEYQNGSIKQNRIIILVVNVLNFNKNIDSAEMCENIKHMILKFLDTCSNRDQIGIVVYGRDSENLMNLNQGTFLGMINHKWDGIIEFLNNLKVFNCFNLKNTKFNTFEEETSNMFEVLKRLMIMNGVEKNHPGDEKYIKKYLHIVNNDCNVKSFNTSHSQTNKPFIKEYTKKIKKIIMDYNLNIMQYNLGNTNTSFLESIMETNFEFDSRFKSFKYLKHKDIEFFKNKKFKIYDLMVDIKLKDFSNGQVKFQCLENTFGHKVQIENNKDLSSVRLNLGDFGNKDFKTFLIDVIILDPSTYFSQQKYHHHHQSSTLLESRNQKVSFIEFNTQWTHKKYGFINGDIYDSGNITFNCRNYASEICENFIHKINNDKKSIPFLLNAEKDHIDDNITINNYNHENTMNNESDFLDILLTAPLSSCRDSVYVMREIEVMIMDVIESFLLSLSKQSYGNNKNNSSMEIFTNQSLLEIKENFKQLYSIIFAMSRNMQIDLPFFNNYMNLFNLESNHLSNYIEYLCNIVSDIIENNIYDNTNDTIKSHNMIIIFKLYNLLNNLKYQTRYNI